ncbi:hypothetical protein FVER53590_25054 [Fusarium verticillioides]|nr:hypothetical protein FVER53590_25054 [Fusarium verticillioides]
MELTTQEESILKMHVFERALPLALTVFCGVVGGFYTFQPIFANDAQKKVDSPPRDLIPSLSFPSSLPPSTEEKAEHSCCEFNNSRTACTRRD